eukprot:3221859-Prymnesium_polylepis.1
MGGSGGAVVVVQRMQEGPASRSDSWSERGCCGSTYPTSAAAVPQTHILYIGTSSTPFFAKCVAGPG